MVLDNQSKQGAQSVGFQYPHSPWLRASVSSSGPTLAIPLRIHSGPARFFTESTVMGDRPLSGALHSQSSKKCYRKRRIIGDRARFTAMPSSAPYTGTDGESVHPAQATLAPQATCDLNAHNSTGLGSHIPTAVLLAYPTS